VDASVVETSNTLTSMVQVKLRNLKCYWHTMKLAHTQQHITVTGE